MTRAGVLVLVFIALVSAEAQAQSVSQVLTFLTTNQSVDTGNPARDVAAAQAASETIARAVVANLATIPIASTSGGFVYRLNPEIGTVDRATDTFGPFFVERAMTAGRGQASIGVSVQHLHFTSIGGRDLRDGSLVATANQFVDESAPFDVDHLTLGLDATVATFYGNVGVSDRVDVGFAVPMTALQLEGSRVDVYRGRTFAQATASATAIGLADLLVRTKVALYEEGNTGLAAAVDVRLPTGRREDLLGAGTTSVKLSAIGSAGSRALAGHLNVGVSLGGLARELDYGAAIAGAATPRLTLTGELLGRWIDSPGGMIETAAPHPTLAGVETLRLTPDATTLHMLSIVPGFKWNMTQTWVLVGNASVPLTNAGLTSPVTPFIGLDYAFSR